MHTSACKTEPANVRNIIILCSWCIGMQSTACCRVLWQPIKFQIYFESPNQIPNIDSKFAVTSPSPPIWPCSHASLASPKLSIATAHGRRTPEMGIWDLPEFSAKIPRELGPESLWPGGWYRCMSDDPGVTPRG